MSAVNYIQELPIPVIQLILGRLDPKSRARFASTCKRTYKAFIEGVRYVRLQDHRPYLQTVREQKRTYTKLEGLRKMSCVQTSMAVGGLGSFVTACVLISSSGGCCCCTVSAAAATALKYTALSFCGFSFLNFGVAFFSICCGANGQNNTDLANEYNVEDELLKENRRRLQMEDPGPRKIFRGLISNSYQGGDISLMP